ncbi:MAG: hypothetical protein HY961_01530 [Ignavibacteriae bacterium]|nr:hypothetical protein [Ignavibacteriota bacterium]
MVVVRILFLSLLIVLASAIYRGCGQPSGRDWGDYDVLNSPPERASRPVYRDTIPESVHRQMISLGEQWFRAETFGNERVFTDIVGLMNGTVQVRKGNVVQNLSVLQVFLQALDALDGVRGNLFLGNGDAYTSDLVLSFPPNTFLSSTIPVPEKLHTGLDVEAGSPLPLGIVPVHVSSSEKSLPYVINPAKFSNIPQGIGPFAGREKFRLGVSCALCHYSLDVDWDGKPDLKSAKLSEPTEGSPYKPQHAWAIGNQDVHLGWIFALSANDIAGFENSGIPEQSRPSAAREWAQRILKTYKTNPDTIAKEVNRGLVMMPRGFADDTPDGLHNPLQFPSLFTHLNWPFNIDGVMLNASDRNNNVWTTGLDLTQLVALCNDRGGKTAKIIFWEEQGLYSALSAAEYADIVVSRSPAVMHNGSMRKKLVDDILGVSDGVPGLLDPEAMVLIKGVPGAIPDEIVDRPGNAHRLRSPGDFGDDGKQRGPLVGLLGTRVVTPPLYRTAYNLDDLEQRYGLSKDEFVTEAVSVMLDWVQPPPNRTALLSNARTRGLIEKGYEVFKSNGCADCHAGPILTDNRIVPREEIGTNIARTKATELLQALAPPYQPGSGKATVGGFAGFVSNIFGGKKPGYKTSTLRYLWGSAPYLHDGGVAVALKPEAGGERDDLIALLKRPDNDKMYGVAQILTRREAETETYLRANAALSLQALLLQDERAKVITANQQKIYPVPGSSRKVAITSLQIEGIGHEYWIDDTPGGEEISALVAFLLALDDEPGK